MPEGVATVSAESGDDDLPDTGAGSMPMMPAAIGLLIVGGAAMALRAQRS